jgi:hypothetical protein
MNKLIYAIFIVIILIYYYKYISNKPNLHFDQNIPNWAPISTTHILFTRFKEPDISLILKPFINKENTKIFIYNKGDNNLSGIPNDTKNINIINIPNLGWDSYAFLYHIINNYNNLPDYIYNLHASAQYIDSKYNLFIDLLNNNNKTYYGGKLVTCNLDFYLNTWSATYHLNKLINPNETYTISNIRPLEKWLLNKINIIPKFAKFDDSNILYTWGGMFFVHKSKILLYPISFYKELFKEISVWQSEVNHYLERSWYILYGNE